MVEQKEIVLPAFPRGIHLITREIEKELMDMPETGLLHLLLKHTSAALTLNDGDEDLAREKKSSWQKLRDPKMPESIGNCPNHRQVKLFAPSAICDFIEKVEGKPLCQKYGIRKALLEKSRPPRPE